MSGYDLERTTRGVRKMRASFPHQWNADRQNGTLAIEAREGGIARLEIADNPYYQPLEVDLRLLYQAVRELLEGDDGEDVPALLAGDHVAGTLSPDNGLKFGTMYGRDLYVSGDVISRGPDGDEQHHGSSVRAATAGGEAIKEAAGQAQTTVRPAMDSDGALDGDLNDGITARYSGPVAVDG